MPRFAPLARKRRGWTLLPHVLRRKTGVMTAMAIAAAATAALGGCTPATARPPEVTFVAKEQLAQMAPPAPPPTTIIGVDDLLEVVYLKQYGADRAAYRFDVGDALELQFYTRSEPAQTYSVQPDGRIYLPELGYITVEGLTADEIEARIRRGYSRTRLAGPVNVVARVTDAKVNEMIATLARSANGASRTVRVLPDGTITLPLLDLVPVAGRTLAEVQTEINADYRRMFNNLHVSVDLRETNSRRFGVVGEVTTPGIFPLLNQTTALDALTKAGGIRETGKAYSVVIFRPTEKGIQVTTIDAGNGPAALGQLASWKLEPSDVVYVPKSQIADIDKFVQQYIRDVLPFSTSIFYGFNTNLH